MNINDEQADLSHKIDDDRSSQSRLNVAFIDHYYHAKTQSGDFLIKEVLAGCTVDRLWDESWAGRANDHILRKVAEGGYDLIVIHQSEMLARDIAVLARRDPRINAVFVPMWDGCRNLEEDYWRSLEGIRILSFSRTVHERATGYGLFSYDCRFYIDPAPIAPVAHDDAALFFWWRVGEFGWPELRSLIAETPPDRIHLHVAPDPQVDPASLVMPTEEEAARFAITTSSWFETAAEFHAVLGRSNIFVAPRLNEGIGMASLEAMAAGMCVIANDAPTMNEYITPGVNGLLFQAGALAPLDLTRHAELGRRARARVAEGRRVWMRDLPLLRDFMLAPRDTLDPARFDSRRYQAPAAAPRPAAPADAGLPRVTVVTVVRNAPEALAMTIANVAAQDYPRLEYVVIDGGSTDRTLDVIRDHQASIDQWISEPDFGPYDAMNKAAALAGGDYIVFMNAGDWFTGADAVSRAMRDAPRGVDFIIGHHLFRAPDGSREQWNRAADFEQTWRRFRTEAVDGSWHGGMPGHQATFTRTALLREHRYDPRYRIAADHEFLYRMRRAGASFHHSLETIAVYLGGGFSARSILHLYDEWLALAERYGGQGAIDFMAREHAGVLAGEYMRIHHTPAPAPAAAVGEDEAPPPPVVVVDSPWAALEAALDQTRAERDALQAQIDEIRRSASWILTYPMRRVMRSSSFLRSCWRVIPLPGRGRKLR